ncbi:MAG: dTDP-4-dehydrorhamnose reductase [Chloroflexota bacterium]
MKILLFGKNGQLGREFQRTLPTLGEVISLDYDDLDLSRSEDVRAAIRRIAPQVLVNASAYTNVDKAESEESLAMTVNAAAPGIMAEEAARLGAPLIHFSTDYVFDGHRTSPYVETDPAVPLNAYGRSKLAGERAVLAVDGTNFVFRTAWVYSLGQAGFVSKLLGWSRQQETLRVVDDQVSNPTWSRMLAEVASQVLAIGFSHGGDWFKSRRGLYHLANAGFASRYEWAEAILELDPDPAARRTRSLLAAKSADFPTPARRPPFSALDCSRFAETFGLRLPPWKESLRLAMTDQVGIVYNIP